MSFKNKYEFMLFCREKNDNFKSANTILQKYLDKNRDKLNAEVELIDGQTDNVKFNRYEIEKSPTLLILKNQRIVKRWLGKLSYHKLETLMQEIFNN